MANSYTTYIYNHIPNYVVIASDNLFTDTKFLFNNFQDIHELGCHIYLLDTMLQQGRTLPKLQPHSSCGIFVGFSPNHSTGVPLILKLDTGYIYQQLHVVCMVPLLQPYLFFLINNLFLYGINLILIIFPYSFPLDYCS